MADFMRDIAAFVVVGAFVGTVAIWSASLTTVV